MSDREGYLKRRDQLLMQDEEIAELKTENAELRDAMTEVLENVPMGVHYRHLLVSLLQENGEAEGRIDDLEDELAALKEAAQDVADQRGTFALWSCSEAGAIRAIDKLKALLQEKGE